MAETAADIRATAPFSSVPRVGPAPAGRFPAPYPLPPWRGGPPLPVMSVSGQRPDRTGNVQLGRLAFLDAVDLNEVVAGLDSRFDGKADAATTLAGYGITDAKIESGTITLGLNTITPLTSHQELRYALVSPQPSNGVVALQDRAVNRVQVQAMEDYAWTWSDGNDHGEPYFVTGDGEWAIDSPDLIVESISPPDDGTATSLTVTCDDIREYTITNAVPVPADDEVYSMTFTPVSGGEPASEVMVTLGDEVELTIAGRSYYSMGPVMGTSGTVRFQGYPVFTVAKSPVYVSDVSSVQPPASAGQAARDFLLYITMGDSPVQPPALTWSGATFLRDPGDIATEAGHSYLVRYFEVSPDVFHVTAEDVNEDYTSVRDPNGVTRFYGAAANGEWSELR